MFLYEMNDMHDVAGRDKHKNIMIFRALYNYWSQNYIFFTYGI